MSNECILSILKRFREAIPSFEIRYSIFCGSLFNPGHPSDPSNHQETVPFWGSFTRGLFAFGIWIKKQSLAMRSVFLRGS